MAIKEIRPRHDNTMVVRKWVPDKEPKLIPQPIIEYYQTAPEEGKEVIKEEENPLEFLTEIPEVKLTRKRK